MTTAAAFDTNGIVTGVITDAELRDAFEKILRGGSGSVVASNVDVGDVVDNVACLLDRVLVGAGF
jgi:hypothetical protein